MQSSKEQQGEVRKTSSVISAKKQGKTRMEKTRDLFKKIRDTKGTVHAKMGSIKDRNGMDITEAEDIKKRWQESRLLGEISITSDMQMTPPYGRK